MSDYDAIPSSDKHKHATGKTLNAIPDTIAKTDSTDSCATWCVYFVPVIMVIVFGIIIVAKKIISKKNQK